MTTSDLSNPIINSPYDAATAHFQLGPSGPTGELLVSAVMRSCSGCSQLRGHFFPSRTFNVGKLRCLDIEPVTGPFAL